ncbi:PKD domain-containing protein [Candidatus Pacearchaeota archaeon]|nr:PKD domain-containing protein [Candidatus Pacearchaeota archaeon]
MKNKFIFLIGIFLILFSLSFVNALTLNKTNISVATLNKTNIIVSAVTLSKGDIVEVINSGTNLKVRDAPAGNIISTRSDGNRGLIISDSQTAALGGITYIWWKIRWEDGVEGWSAQGYPGGVDYLKKVSIIPSTKFSINDNIRVAYDAVKVRTEPPELADTGNKVNTGNTGKILSGPFYGVPKGSSGFYYFWKVDYNGFIGWSAENYLEKAMPDLTVTSVNAPTSAKAGDYIAVSWTVKNQGSAPSNSFYNRISLATTPYGTDISLGNYFMNSINAGLSLSDAQVPRIPVDMTPGNYYVTVFADTFQAIAEPNEDNNINKASNMIYISASCTDECSSGTRCSGNYKQTCGNYDDDSCLEWGNNVDCGSNYCDSFGNNYCKSGNVYHSRTCYDKGCSSGACFNNQRIDEQLVQTCSSSQICSNGMCNENQKPTCSLSSTPRSGKAPLKVTFSLSASDSDGIINAWVLDVNGDGNADYSGTGNPPSTLSHTYNNPGQQNVIFLVADNKETQSNPCIDTINVGTNIPPNINLSASPSSGTVPLTVTFSLSARDSDGTIITWVLNYGDGTSDSGTGNPPSTKTHTYTKNNTYGAVLAVSDNDNATAFAIQNINVNPQCTKDSDCGNNNWINFGLCHANDVWQDYITYKCESGKCVSSIENKHKETCPSKVCGNWANAYCKDGDVYNARTCWYKGCVDGACPSDSYIDEEKIEECNEFECIDGKCKIPNKAPNPPINLDQLKSDMLAEINSGGITNERSVFFKADVSDPDRDKVKLQIELRRVDENNGNFLGRFTQQSELINYSKISVPAYGLVNGEYHWRVRAVDEYGLASEWIDFGNNPVLSEDFKVKINYIPFATFTYSPQYPEIGQEIIFDASNSYDPDGGTISYRWDFEDGFFAEGKAVSHSFLNTKKYAVNLTVIDDEGSQKSYSRSIAVFSKELENSINNFVDITNLALDGIFEYANNDAIATDYFAENIPKNENEAIIGLAVDSLSEIFSSLDILKVSRVSVLSVSDYTNLVKKFPYLEGLIEGIDNYGWLSAEIGKDAFFKFSEAASIDLANKLREKNYSYSNTFFPILRDKYYAKKGNITELKNEALHNIESLSQEEINLYKEDLRKRATANAIIKDIYSNKVLLPVTFRDIKLEEAIDWKSIFSKVFLEVGMFSGKLALSLAGAPCWFIFSISGGTSVAEKVTKLNTDSQMVLMGANVLVDGAHQLERVSRNTYQALADIKNKTAPKPVKGEIISIENFEEGYYEYKEGSNIFSSIFYKIRPFYYANKYSKVEVNNTGNVKAVFELVTQYNKKFSTSLLTMLPFLKYELPFVTTDVKEIEPGQTKIFIIWYMEKNEGINPKNQDIRFTLLGENNGIYLVDYDITRFDTTKIVLDNTNITKEELENASSYPYPVSSKFFNNTLFIFFENPFDFPVGANLTQEIPSDLEIISVENGTINGNNISWQFKLEPEERKEITIVLRPKKEIFEEIKIPPGLLKIYDYINDNWLEFLSNNLSMLSECTKDSDCGNNGWINFGLCHANDVWQDFVTYKCEAGKCVSSIENKYKETCQSKKCGNWANAYCKDGDVYNARTCWYKGCVDGACPSDSYIDEEKIEECNELECVDGSCCSITVLNKCSKLDKPNQVYVLNSSINTGFKLTNSVCLKIEAENITLNCKGNSIRSNMGIGIYSDKKFTTIKNCNISMGLRYDGTGIKLIGRADNSYIFNNTLTQNVGGIYLTLNSGTIIENNNLNGNKIGIDLGDVSSLRIINNIANSNQYGIRVLFGGLNNLFINNIANSNQYGIYFWTSPLASNKNNQIINNTANYNNETGIYLYGYPGNIIQENNASFNKYGIYLDYASNNNSLINNIVESNLYGISTSYSSNTNLLYNNANNNRFSGILLGNPYAGIRDASYSNITGNIACGNNKTIYSYDFQCNYHNRTIPKNVYGAIPPGYAYGYGNIFSRIKKCGDGFPSNISYVAC